ncbi:MAG: hypothetical protein K2Q18_10035, partial [Bdellovibrionales bacterium]|nr:hypothetical protein [Bdellovibrionales bacterium]
MRNFFKKLLISLLGLFLFLVMMIVIIGGILFYNPTIIINPNNLDYALKKSSILEFWSWKDAEINHEWINWNKRRFYGNFKDLCLVYDGPDVNVDTCMEAVSWNVELNWTRELGFNYKVYEPLVVNSSKLQVRPKENPEVTPPPDLMSYWDIFWGPIVPDLIVQLKEIEILKAKVDPIVFDLMMNKTNKVLHAEALGFHLDATKEKIKVYSPKKLLLPFDLKTKNPLYFSEFIFEAKILKNTIPIVVNAKIESAVIKFETFIDKTSLKEDLNTPKFLSTLIQRTKGSISVEKIKETIYNLARPPYNVLPAPVNSMEGSLKLDLIAEKYQMEDSVLLKIKFVLNMAGAKQDLVLAVNSDIPFDLRTKTISGVTLGLELMKVKLLLPKLSRTRLPPQLIPDSRFKNSTVIIKQNLNQQKLPPKMKKAPARRDVEFDLRLQALGANALAFNTNLLDETLKMNFDLEIFGGEIQKGFVQTLPFRTSIFKRKILVQSLRMVFNFPLEPEIIATIV